MIEKTLKYGQVIIITNQTVFWKTTCMVNFILDIDYMTRYEDPPDGCGEVHDHHSVQVFRQVIPSPTKRHGWVSGFR